MENNTDNKDSKKRPVSWTGLGIAYGVAFGAVFDNIGLGIALGLAIGAGLDHRKKKNE